MIEFNVVEHNFKCSLPASDDAGVRDDSAIKHLRVCSEGRFAGELSDESGPGFSVWKFDRKMEVIAYVGFFKDAHSVLLCRLFDDLFYFTEVFMEP